jgi:hypothetical protein
MAGVELVELCIRVVEAQFDNLRNDGLCFFAPLRWCGDL